MVTFAQLRASDPSTIDKVVAQWDKVCQKFDTAHRTARGRVGDKMRGGSWRGEAATTAVQRIGQYEAQLVAGHREANAIKQVLKNGGGLLKNAKGSLDHTLGSIAKDPRFTVSDQGVVYPSPQALAAAGAATEQITQEAVKLSRDIASAVSAANYVDRQITSALRQASAIDTPRSGFFNDRADDRGMEFLYYMPLQIMNMYGKDGGDLKSVYIFGPSLNEKERAVLDQVSSTEKQNALVMMIEARLLYGGDVDNGNDAKRHAYWSASTTQIMGPQLAEKLLSAHEQTPEGGTNYQHAANATAMDLHNNRVGREIAVANPEAHGAALQDLIDKKYREGGFLTLDKNGNLVPSG